MKEKLRRNYKTYLGLQPKYLLLVEFYLKW